MYTINLELSENDKHVIKYQRWWKALIHVQLNKKASKMKWTPIHIKTPEWTQRCVFHDPSGPMTAFGVWLDDGFHLNGHVYKGTHWVDCQPPSKEEINEVIEYFKS